MLSGNVEIGIGIQSDKLPGEYARLATAIEGYGFDVISVYADLLYQPPIVALLEMAAATDRVRLGAACWNPFTMHPYEIAGQLAALDSVSHGRSYLGLARGTWLGQIGVAQSRPIEHLSQAVGVIRALLTGDDRAIEADIFPLAAGTVLRYQLPVQLPPLLIGTWGPKLAALAGMVADEVKVGGSANPSMVGVMRERIAVGADSVHRDRAAVGIVIGAVTVVDEDGAAARALARVEVAMYLAVVGELDPTVNLDPKMVQGVKTFVAKGDLHAAGNLIPDAVLDLFAFSGTPAQVADQAQRVIDAGAKRVEFGTPHGRAPGVGIELLGREVLPMLRLD